MSRFLNTGIALATSIIVIAVAVGCGTTNAPVAGTRGAVPVPPAAQACTTPISGNVRALLDGKPIAGALAVLETGTPQIVAGVVTREVIFLETARTTTDASGAFRLCAPGPVSVQTVVVLLALDTAENEYPPYVAVATDALDLEAIAMGECFFACDTSIGMMPNQAPAVLEGAVTTTPGARAGLVTAQIGIPPIDGSQTTWSIAIPGLGMGETNTFQTAPQTGMDSCTGMCASYRFTVPTRNPVVQSNLGHVPLLGSGTYTGSGWLTQEGGETLYSIYATAPGCKLPFSAAVPLASDGHSFVPVTPGVVIKVQNAPFTECN